MNNENIDQEKSFEKSMTRLEEIVSLLEKGDVTLEESVRLFEEGTSLAAGCKKMLDEAEQKIENLSLSA